MSLCGHSAVYSGTWPTSGMTRSGSAYELPTWAPPTAGSGCSSSPGREAPTPVPSLLPTPEAKLSDSGPDYARANREGSGGDDLTTTIHRHLLPTPTGTNSHGNGHNSRGEPLLPAVAASLLPTPTARDWKGANQRGDATCLPGALIPMVSDQAPPDSNPLFDGEGTATWLARRERVKQTANNGNGMGMPLTIAVQLLPTPSVADAMGGHLTRSGARSGELLLPGVARDLASRGESTNPPSDDGKP